MKIHNPRSLPKLLILLLCTALIIFTNYTFIKKATLDIKLEMIKKEYINIWWKDNYMILKELQKEEMLNYLNKLKTEQPELIYKLRQRAIINEEENKQILTWEVIKELKESSYIKWNSEALISIIEFSDMECSYCIESHNNGTINKVLEKYEKNINYSFKNIPWPKHPNARKIAKAAKCVEKISSWEKYLEFIDLIFKNMNNNWYNIEFIDSILDNNNNLFNINNIPNMVNEIWIHTEKFNKCYLSKDNKYLVENEILQWKKLQITYTPSFVIINNLTWEYKILTWIAEETTFDETVDMLLFKED